jgi:hypothetical protein
MLSLLVPNAQSLLNGHGDVQVDRLLTVVLSLSVTPAYSADPWASSAAAWRMRDTTLYPEPA